MERRGPRHHLLLLLIPALLLTAGSSPADEAPAKLLGECSAADLAAAPFDAWYGPGYDGYVPAAEILEELRALDLEGVEVLTFFGTWCGDSRREVPRMRKLLDALGFPESSRRLIAVDNVDELHKRSPDGEEAGLEIYRVPTFVIRRDGREIGRMVEYPARSLERDLAAILAGGGYAASYATFPIVERWLSEGLLADPNVNADGLANEVRAMASSEWELYSSARVLRSRGDFREAALLMEVNCSLYWTSAWCHHRLAEMQLAAGDRQQARRSVVRALERNDDPDRVGALVELVDRTAAAAAPAVAGLEEELRASETAFADAFARGDMDAFEGFLDDGAVFFSRDDPLRGRAAIAAAWRGYRGAAAEPPFTWRPERVAIEAGGLHGLSTGPVFRDGRWVSSYVSTWRLTPDGWRIILDVGPRCPPPAAAPDG